jgi:hypothetical protein
MHKVKQVAQFEQFFCKILNLKPSPLLDIKAWNQKANHLDIKKTLASTTSHQWLLEVESLTTQIMKKLYTTSHEWLE